MDNQMLSRIDAYVEDLYSHTDEVLNATLASIKENDMPSINVSPNEGRLLYLLAKMSRASSILEIGTLAGYSGIWLARALPDDGHMVTLEYSPKHAEVSRQNIERAGLGNKVEIRVGAALDSLAKLAEAGEGPFDLIFIDADKDNYPGYLEWAIKLSHPGTVILSDNLIRGGAVMEANPEEPAARVIAGFNREIAHNPRLESLVVPLVRENVDGLGISIVK